jgi:putative transposase
MTVPAKERRSWIASPSPLSIERRCALIGLPRSTYYYCPRIGESIDNIAIMHQIDRIYTAHPEFGVPRITDQLHVDGLSVNHKRVARLMRLMGLQALLPGPHTSRPHPDHTIYPYLLRGRTIKHPDEVWASDITYIPMVGGFVFLMAIMDWSSRYVITWELSRTLEARFCIQALENALRSGQPKIFNTDQGAQFTCDGFLAPLNAAQIAISMNGRGRALDNVFVERLWRTVKYEHIYLHEFETIEELHASLREYFLYYNHERRHSSLRKQTPAQVYQQRPRA